MPTTWTKWPDHDDHGNPTGRWCIGPDGGDPVAVTVTATEPQANALAASLEMLAALEMWIAWIDNPTGAGLQDGISEYYQVARITRDLVAKAKGGQ